MFACSRISPININCMLLKYNSLGLYQYNPSIIQEKKKCYYINNILYYTIIIYNTIILYKQFFKVLQVYNRYVLIYNFIKKLWK